ncbi:hypothetical protein FA048_17465 [Pedobacter polaris]|uniref:Uncharacterized protein n=1 Tax=Pedobacter polaris TaxID=2571273 RepID=A0A4U1CKG8_9SPHI|nr:hypothetical protein [Pedobacter polaris]TKC05514.1 hypothetical protein FA048_17465 [Pedobacter polaris]
MKKGALFFFLFLIGIHYSYSQDLPILKHVKLNKKVHFKDTEALVLKVINYLFETPIDKKNNARTEAGQFLIKWMNGTPEYTFYLEEKETNFFNTDSDLMLMYMAGLTKFTLENKEVKDQKTLVIGALKSVLPYLNNQENKKRWSTELWQLNEANQKGKLEEFLYQ